MRSRRSRRSQKLSHTQTSVPCGTLNKLHIAQDCIHSQTNPTGNILIDNAFRIGKKLGEKPRPLVVVFNTQKSKKLVIEQYKQEESARERALCQLTECF